MKKSKNGRPTICFQRFSALEWEKIKATRGGSVQGKELIALAKGKGHYFDYLSDWVFNRYKIVTSGPQFEIIISGYK